MKENSIVKCKKCGFWKRCDEQCFICITTGNIEKTEIEIREVIE